MIRLLVFTAILLLLDFYAFQNVKTLSKSKIVFWGYWSFSIIVLIAINYGFYTYDRNSPTGQNKLLLPMGLMVLSFVPKLFLILPLLLEDIYRVFHLIFQVFQKDSAVEMESRREFVSKLALGVAAIPFAGILYGIIKGRYNFKVVKHTLFFEDLPEAFDGYQITHISDIHSGSFDDESKIDYAINLINEQESDVILFTGDIVNNFAEEMNPWISYFKKLKAIDGKFSVLGNHDYGEYVPWESKAAKEANFNAVKAIHPKIGFKLLLNDSVYLNKGEEKLAIVGVENWGTKFKKAGDLNLASKNVKKEDFKILMSHDPSHWEVEVKEHDQNYQLTLSGHTHGMQFGIEIPGIKWSPVQYVYKYWAGVYKEFGRYINVNRGFGFLAFPGRVGIWPEISVITLKKA